MQGIILAALMRFRHLSQHALRIMLGGALAVCLVAGVVWGIAAYRYHHVLVALVEAGREEGYTVEYNDQGVRGFPSHTIVRLEDIRWKSPDGITFHADDMTITSPMWGWRKFDVAFPKGALLTVPLDQPGEALRLAAGSGTAHIMLDNDRHWRLGLLTLDHAAFGRDPDYVFQSAQLICRADRPEQEPQDVKSAGLTLSAEADTVAVPDSIPSPFGKVMQHAGLALRVMGAVPDVRRKDDVAAWNKTSGVVAFDHLDMDWGVLNLRARGTMGFDDELQPEGALAAALTGHEAVIKVLLENGFIAQRQAGMLGAALSLFAKAAPPPDRDHPAQTQGIELPVAVQLGGLFFGPVKIFSFPEIVWQEGVSLGK